MFSHDAFTGVDIVAMVKKVQAFYGPSEKVAIFLDNASIHRAQIAKEAAADIGVRLIYNIPYRPDLNGIELLWRRAKVAYYNLVDSWRAQGLRTWNQDDIVRKCVEEVQHAHIRGIADGGWSRLYLAEPVYAEVRAWEAATMHGLAQQQKWWTHELPPANVAEVRKRYPEPQPQPPV